VTTLDHAERVRGSDALDLAFEQPDALIVDGHAVAAL
jgi:hypothetical protein